ncbi:hypothetical protein D9M68_626380 [compost metagenome]
MVTFYIFRKIFYLELRIFGNVDQHRAWSSAFGNIECFGQNFGYFFSIGYLIIPFGYGGRDIDHIGFLKGIGT